MADNLYNNQNHIRQQWLQQRRDLVAKRKRCIDIGYTKKAMGISAQIKVIDRMIAKLTSVGVGSDGY